MTDRLTLSSPVPGPLRLTWKHRPDCVLADAEGSDEAVMLVNVGPCPCSPGGERYEPYFVEVGE